MTPGLSSDADGWQQDRGLRGLGKGPELHLCQTGEDAWLSPGTWLRTASVKAAPPGWETSLERLQHGAASSSPGLRPHRRDDALLFATTDCHGPRVQGQSCQALSAAQKGPRGTKQGDPTKSPSGGASLGCRGPGRLEIQKARTQHRGCGIHNQLSEGCYSKVAEGCPQGGSGTSRVLGEGAEKPKWKKISKPGSLNAATSLHNLPA